MTWRLSVEHVTTYEYAGDVLASYNEARLTPSRDRQLVLDHRVHVTPRVPVMRYIDYWGSEVCSFDVTEPHQRLVVTGRSLVETAPSRALPVRGEFGAAGSGWERLRAEDLRDQLHEYLNGSDYVVCDDPRVVAAALELTALDSPAAAVGAAGGWDA